MKRSEIKNNLEYCGLTEEDLKPHIKTEGSRGKWKYRDSRTWRDEEGAFHVYPYGFTRHQVYIACPICGETHYHGIGSRIDKDYWGWRTVHCRVNKVNFTEYYIERLDPETEKDLMEKSKGSRHYYLGY